MKKGYLVLFFLVFLLGFLSGKIFLQNNEYLGGFDNKKLSLDSKVENIDLFKELNLDINSQNLKKIENKNFYSNVEKNVLKQGENVREDLYYYLFEPVIYFLLEEKNNCEDIYNKILVNSKNSFLENCNFVYYRKKLLENKGDFDVPKDFLEKNNFLKFVKNKKCILEENHACALLFSDISRKNFIAFGLEFMKNDKVDINDIDIVDYGFSIFSDNLNSIRNDENILNLFYDEALINKAIFERDTKYCDNILYESKKQYCIDIFDKNAKQKYEEIFYDFFKPKK